MNGLLSSPTLIAQWRDVKLAWSIAPPQPPQRAYLALPWTATMMQNVVRQEDDNGHQEQTEVGEVQEAAMPTHVFGRHEPVFILIAALNLFGVSAQQEERYNPQELWLPLDEIEVKKPGHNRQLVADYSYWFHNY